MDAAASDSRPVVLSINDTNAPASSNVARRRSFSNAFADAVGAVPDQGASATVSVSYTHLDVYKRQEQHTNAAGWQRLAIIAAVTGMGLFTLAFVSTCLLYTSRCV